jgi:hypothetical protein
MKRRIFLGLALGIVAGVLDAIPMIVQGMTWDAVWGAFSLWLVVGFMLATSSLTLPAFVKGIVIALLCLLPSLFIIGWHDPLSLVPIVIITIVLGALLGIGHQFLQGRDLGVTHDLHAL